MFNANRFVQAIMCASAVGAVAIESTSHESMGSLQGSSSTLFVASYAGSITTLSLARGTTSNDSYSFEAVSSNADCGPNPSWLTLDSTNKVLYCLDEGLDVPNGTLSSFTIQPNGVLSKHEKMNTVSGPVSGAIYGNGSFLAAAHYSGSALTTYSLQGKTAGFSEREKKLFKLTKPGTNPDRQDAPHEHEAIVDPTGKYLLVPDLGADLVRVFGYNETGGLIDKQPLAVVPGSGPRHAAFYIPSGKPNCTTYLYVVTELGNTVTGYQVTYLSNYGGLQFKQVYTSNVYGGKPMPKGIATAEVAVSPDNRFLVISNRNDSAFSLPNPDPKNSTQIKSDSMSTFELQKDGTLKFTQLAPVGGIYPRQFAMNAAGDLVAVGLQLSSAVTLLERDVKTGMIGKIVARQSLNGQITCVRWNEKTFDGTYANH